MAFLNSEYDSIYVCKPTVSESEFDRLLRVSGVANNLGHYENEKLHTAITSREELKKLVDLAYQSGHQSHASDYDPNSKRQGEF